MSISLNSQIRDAISGGLGDDKTINDLANMHNAPIELIELMLKWGMDVEMEHTDDEGVAKEIAMDHIAEDPLYYKKLKIIEGE